MENKIKAHYYEFNPKDYAKHNLSLVECFKQSQRRTKEAIEEIEKNKIEVLYGFYHKKTDSIELYIGVIVYKTI